MRAWTRSHAVLPAGVIVLTAAALVRIFPRAVLGVPSFLTGQIVTLPLGYVVAILPSLVWIVCRLRGRSVLERVSPRRTQLAVAECGYCVFLAAVFAAVLLSGGGGVLAGSARNAVFGASMALVAMSLVPTVAALLGPVATLLACVFFGFPASTSHASRWAVLVTPWSAWHLFILIAVPAALAFYVGARRSRSF